MPAIAEGQLSIPVPPAPHAIGRWTADDEIREYAKDKGTDKALEQKKLAEESRECNCGVQASEDAKAKDEDRHAKKVSGFAHKAGCPLLRERSKVSVRINQDEQIRRYTSSV